MKICKNCRRTCQDYETVCVCGAPLQPPQSYNAQYVNNGYASSQQNNGNGNNYGVYGQSPVGNNPYNPNAQAPVGNNYGQANSQPPYGYNPNPMPYGYGSGGSSYPVKKSKTKKIVIISVITVLIIALGIGAYFLFFRFDPNESPENVVKAYENILNGELEYLDDIISPAKFAGMNEYEKREKLAAIKEDCREGIAENKERFGADYRVKSKVLYKERYDNLDSLKESYMEYGIVIQDCYICHVEGTISGSKGSDYSKEEMRVVKINGKWYMA